MVPADLMLLFAKRMEEIGAKYFVTGSMAAMLYSEQRTTHDVDVAVDLRFGEVPELVQYFREPEYYLDIVAIRRAMEHNMEFNIIHVPSALKIDVMVPDGSEFNKSRFSRARKIVLETGQSVVFAAPEDVILKKLQYYREGQSDKHLRDIGSMLKISGDVMDFEYLERWARELKVEDLWVKCKGRVGM